jgi:hypothetical protein
MDPEGIEGTEEDDDSDFKSGINKKCTANPFSGCTPNANEQSPLY